MTKIPLGTRVIINPTTEKEAPKAGLIITPTSQQAFKSGIVVSKGKDVTAVNVGDKVYVPTEELKRGTFVTINEESYLMVAYHSIALVW